MNLVPVFLSLQIAGTATLIVTILGLPLAYLLAIKSFRGKNIIESLLALPMVLPPTVLGYYLLVLLGRNSLFGAWLKASFGISLVFTKAGAILAVVAVIFPLLVRTAQAGFEQLDQDLLSIATTLGASSFTTFWRLAIPMAWKAVISGIMLAFTRGMGEFGATLMIAGSIPGKTQTLSLAIYEAVQSGDKVQANRLVALISILTFLVLWWTNKNIKNRI
ncbi:MAG: molybdate ABC transporter permease subunit [Clostridia bacterium]